MDTRNLFLADRESARGVAPISALPGNRWGESKPHSRSTRGSFPSVFKQERADQMGEFFWRRHSIGQSRPSQKG
jgi:hypothetical protein